MINLHHLHILHIFKNIIHFRVHSTLVIIEKSFLNFSLKFLWGKNNRKNFGK